MYSSTFYFLVVLVVGLILVLLPYLFYHYSYWSKLDWHAKLTVGLAWLMAFTYVLLLTPLDIAITLQARCILANTPANNTMSLPDPSACALTSDEVQHARSTLIAFWRVTFWLVSIVLGWIVMGVQSSYLYSGAFSFVSRLKEAIKVNALIYGITVGVGAVAVIYLMIQYNAEYAAGFVFAISNLYSLFLITCLMSYGLINIPRRLWFEFRWRDAQQQLYFDAWSFNQTQSDALYEVKCKIAVIKKLRSKIRDDDELGGFVQQMVAELDLYIPSIVPPTANLPQDDFDSIPDELDETFLAAKRTELRVAAAEYQRATVCLQKIEESFVHYEDLKAAQDNNEGTITWSTAASSVADDSFLASSYNSLSHSTLFRRVEYFWMLRLRPIMFLALCVAAVGWSAFTVVAEMSLVSGRSPNLSIISSVENGLTDARPYSVFFAIFMMMGYQVSATFYTLFRLQLGEFYRVAAYHQTTPDNLVTNALFLARFAPALVQNFFKLLHEETDCSAAGVVCPSFTEFFGAIDLMPLGPGIQIILPLLLGVLMVVTWQGTKIYERWLKDYNFVLLQWIEDHIETEDRLKVGRSVLERAARRYQHTGFARLDAVSSATPSVSDRMIERAPSRTTQYEADDMALEVVPSSSVSLRNDDKPDVQSFLASVRERREQQKARRK